MPNACGSFGTILSIVAVILLIFGQISQTTNSSVTSHLRLASISTSNLSSSINARSGGTVDVSNSLYFAGEDGSDAGGNAKGLRRTYEWGFWGFCASTSDRVGASRSYYSTPGFNAAFTPYATLYADVPLALRAGFNATVPESVFTADAYLGKYSQGANYITFIGAVFALLATLLGLGARRFAFLLGAVLALLGSLSLLVGMTVYTIMFVKVSDALKEANVGVSLAYGNGLWIMWAGTAAMFLAVLPYFVACCVGRKEPKLVQEKYQY